MDPINPSGIPEAPAPEPIPEILDAPLRLRPELVFDIRNQGGRDVYIIEDKVRGKFYQIGVNEFRLISQLDGERKAITILEQINARSKSTISTNDASKICNWLVQSNLAAVPNLDSSKRLQGQNDAIQTQKQMSVLNPISIKFRLFNPTRLLDASQSFAKLIFSGWFMAVWLIVGTIGLYHLFADWEKLSLASIGILSNGRWIWMLAVWVLLKAIHEWAHGIACRKYGGSVPEAGMLLLLFTPMPFVNVTSSWRFKNRWQRFVVAGAGMYVELFISFIAMIVWSQTSNQLCQDICFNIFFLSSVTTVLFNANPLMRFDGYFMLTDVLDIPNLYPKGIKFFGDRLKNLLFGTPKSGDICATREVPYVRVYGALAFCWKILISISLLIAASMLFWGFGLIMAIAAGVLWLAMPVYRFFCSVFAVPETSYRTPRVVVSTICIALALVGVFTLLGSPAKKSAPAIVEFEQEEILRAGGDGFIDQILVGDGKAVKKGQTLIVIRNEVLSTDVENLKRQITEAEIRARIYTKEKELASAQTELQNRESFIKQLVEKQSQLDNLTMLAPFDGFVFARNLPNRNGEYIEHGAELLRIAKSTSRKLVVSIEQEDLASIKGTEGTNMKVVMPGTETFLAPLTTIQPRATSRPKHPGLCASYGGPLAVEPIPASDSSEDSQSKFRFLTPRFEVELSIDDSLGQELHCGQVGYAFFAAKRQSLGAYLFIRTKKWFQQQIDQAMIGR